MTEQPPAAPPAPEAPAEREPWLQQPDEPAGLFARFARFLSMGPRRSLRRLCQAELREAGERPPARVNAPGGLCRASVRWGWIQRAAAYDLHRAQELLRQPPTPPEPPRPRPARSRARAGLTFLDNLMRTNELLLQERLARLEAAAGGVRPPQEGER